MIDLVPAVAAVALVLASVCGAGVVLSRVILRPSFWRDETDYLERLTISFLIGALAFQFVVWAVGTYRFDLTAVWSIVFAFAVSAAWGIRQLLTDAGRIFPVIRNSDALTKASVLCLALVVLALVVAANAPPNDWDSLTYHLRLVKYDLEIGYILPDVATSKYYFYPRLFERLGGVLYVIAGETAAQLTGVVFVVLICLVTARIGQLLGLSRAVIAVGLLIFVTIRTVIFQAPAFHNDLALTFAGLVLLLALIRIGRNADTSWYIIAAIALGYAINTKYTGLQIGLVAAVTALVCNFRAYMSVRVIWAAVLCIVIVTPLFVHNVWFTGNPVYPWFDFLFGDAVKSLHLDTQGTYGRGQGIFAFIVSPFDQFLYPNKFFDGHQWGSPLVLILFPFGVWALRKSRPWRMLWVYLGIFYVTWFFAVIQIVRYLTPIMPIIALICAAGVVSLWQTVRQSRPARGAFGLVLVLLAFNQVLFVGGEFLVQLPVGTGIVSRSDFLASRPNINFQACDFVTKHLSGGATYVSTLNLDYYCPQAAKRNLAIFKDGNRSTAEVLERHKVKYLVFQKYSVQKFKSADASIYLLQSKTPWKSIETAISKFPDDYFSKITPVFEEKQAAVYRVSDIIQLVGRHN